MKELALNILDICNNSVEAGASLIEIIIDEAIEPGQMAITINDNGRGMDKQTLIGVENPWFTTRTTRRQGLGIPLFKQHAMMTGGSFKIDSTPGKGTTLRAVFISNSVDRQPMGDLAGTLLILAGNTEATRIVMRYVTLSGSWTFDSDEIKSLLGIDRISGNTLTSSLRELIEHNIGELNPSV